MKLTIFIFCFLLVILSPHGLFSKSISNKEYSKEGENLNAKTDVDRLGSDETVALHESYRPRHKYKGVSGHQPRTYRSDAEFEKEQDIKNPQCAVMYKNNEPVGILQPFEESYRFLPLNGEPTLVDLNPIPVKRKTIMDVLYPSKIIDDYDDEVIDNNEQFADDRYPSIFAKFKIDSRLDKSLNPDVTMKRPMYKRKSEKTDLDEDQVGSLKSTLTKMKSDDSVAVEEELKNILDDMGLIDDYPEKEEAKREAEDENLEQGTNKINLIKEEHKDKRNKRDEGNLISTFSTGITFKKGFSSQASTMAVPKSVQFIDKEAEEAERIDLFNPNEDAKIDDESDNLDSEVSTEKLEMRKKRQDKCDNLKDKHKRDIKINSFENFTTPNLIEEGELNDIEKRVEREIRDKIEKLKDEVKKEISDLKQFDNKNKETASDAVIDPKRRKRQVINTLLDEETADIDPTINTDGQIVRQIRRKKRSVEENRLGSYHSQVSNNTFKTQDLKYITNDLTTLKDDKINIYPKENISRSNTDTHKVRIIRRFIGVNPVLETANFTKYHTRALKQYNIDPNNENANNEPHVRVKREQIDKDADRISQLFEGRTENRTNVRRKRQIGDEMEDNAYEYNDSQFNEEMPYYSQSNNKENLNDNANIDEGRVDISQITGNSKICHCDKNGNNCKCGNQDVDPSLPTFKPDYSDHVLNPSGSIEKKSVDKTHCNCGKNEDHCKCGHFFEDAPESLNYDYSDYPEVRSNIIEKKSANPSDKAILSDESLNESESLNDKETLNDQESLNDKEALNDFHLDSQFSVPKRTRQRRKGASRKAEDEYDNYETGENSLAKREVKSGKHSGNEPFQNGEYFVDLHPDVYRLSPVDNSRGKRENFNQLIAIHGGGPVRSHLVAIKQRSMMPHTRFRRRVQNDDNKELRQLIDMSDEELFGALPQSFEGELARYKRVKRAKAKK